MTFPATAAPPTPDTATVNVPGAVIVTGFIAFTESCVNRRVEQNVGVCIRRTGESYRRRCDIRARTCCKAPRIGHSTSYQCIAAKVFGGSCNRGSELSVGREIRGRA